MQRLDSPAISRDFEPGNLSAGKNGSWRQCLPIVVWAFTSYRTDAQESVGVDPTSETSNAPGVPQARRRAPRSGAKEGGGKDLTDSELDHSFTSICSK